MVFDDEEVKLAPKQKIIYTKMIGGSGGGYFNDKLPDSDLYNPDWRLSHIRVRYDEYVNGIQIYFKNDKARYRKTMPLHGGEGGTSKYEAVHANECIYGVHVNV